MKCHIIGNGHSRNLFKENKEFKICLNVYSFPCDLLFAVDDIAIKHLYKNDFYKTNTVISDKLDIESNYIIDKVIHHQKHVPGFKSVKASYNVGHCAYDWCRKNNYNEIHLWGFDIFYNKSLVSLSDAIFGHTTEYKKTKKFEVKAEMYLKVWNHIIDTTTYVHIPSDEKIILDNKHLKSVKHGYR